MPNALKKNVVYVRKNCNWTLKLHVLFMYVNKSRAMRVEDENRRDVLSTLVGMCCVCIWHRTKNFIAFFLSNEVLAGVGNLPQVGPFCFIFFPETWWREAEKKKEGMGGKRQSWRWKCVYNSNSPGERFHFFLFFQHKKMHLFTHGRISTDGKIMHSLRLIKTMSGHQKILWNLCVNGKQARGAFFYDWKKKSRMEGRKL